MPGRGPSPGPAVTEHLSARLTASYAPNNVASGGASLRSVGSPGDVGDMVHMSGSPGALTTGSTAASAKHGGGPCVHWWANCSVLGMHRGRMLFVPSTPATANAVTMTSLPAIVTTGARLVR